MIQLKFIILFWIIALIIFTFYCIYRFSTNKYITSQFNDTPNPNTNPNLIQYINELQSHDKITNIPGCENIYDDNIAIRTLGYNNCASANADYFNRNLDINNKYGNSKTLAQLCPVSTKSTEYLNCMRLLLDKFNTNATIVDKINTDMTNILNNRLQERSNILNIIETSINPFIYSKDQTDFINNSGELNLNLTPENILENTNTYYQSKYGISKNIFDNIPLTTPTMNHSTLLNLDPYIVDNFFGIYNAIPGQYIAFNDLTITISYEQDNTNSPILIITDTNQTLIYKLENIDYYRQYKNVIKLDITKLTIQSTQPNNTTTLQQLLNTLGIIVPGRILISLEEYTSTEHIKHKTYKILNASNMATIIILEKKT